MTGCHCHPISPEDKGRGLAFTGTLLFSSREAGGQDSFPAVSGDIGRQQTVDLTLFTTFRL